MVLSWVIIVNKAHIWGGGKCGYRRKMFNIIFNVEASNKEHQIAWPHIVGLVLSLLGGFVEKNFDYLHFNQTTKIGNVLQVRRRRVCIATFNAIYRAKRFKWADQSPVIFILSLNLCLKSIESYQTRLIRL